MKNEKGETIEKVEVEEKIQHATKLLEDALTDSVRHGEVGREGIHVGGNKTTIHHQHVIYKNQEQKVCMF